MSTKSTIQNLINTNLADASSITASEHRAVENSLLNELYPTPIYENHVTTTNTITAKNPTIEGLNYSISIVKQGLSVTITGYLQNNSSAIIGESEYFFEIINSEYFPNSGNPFVSLVYDINVNRRIIINTNTKRLSLTNSGIGNIDFFQITYQTFN
jgi:hypothetical protein